jgi:hypothetical protein
MKFSKLLSAFILILIAGLSVSAQQAKNEDPLYVYLCERADSVLVFNPTSSWNMGTPRFSILSKKGNKISFYEYVGYSALRNPETTDFTAVQKKLRRLRRVLITKVTPKMKEYFCSLPHK